MSSSTGCALCCFACLLGSAAGNFVSPGLGKCLDIQADLKADVKGDATKNANLNLVACGGENQKWDLTGYGYVKLDGAELCMDVKAAKKDDGTFEKWSEIKEHDTVNVQLYTCHNPEKTKRVNQLWQWAPYTGDKVVSAWEFQGGSILKSNTSGTGWMAVAAAGMASLFAAGIFIGLRMRKAAKQQPLANQELE